MKSSTVALIIGVASFEYRTSIAFSSWRCRPHPLHPARYKTPSSLVHPLLIYRVAFDKTVSTDYTGFNTCNQPTWSLPSARQFISRVLAGHLYKLRSTNR
jgi:hypothetical protein